MQNMKQHITIVGALHIGLSVLGLLLAFFLFAVIAGGGALSGDSEAITITLIVGSVIGGLLAVLSVPGIVAGWGLLKYQGWARILMMVVAAFDLFNVPIGTALGVYTFWVLIQEETTRLFSPQAAQ
jgi:hypothetical protein